MQSQEIRYSNAIVRVHRPDLANDEREKRMKEIRISAEKILKGVIKNDTSNLRNYNNSPCSSGSSLLDF